ncbi:MAG: hypothetical protein HYT61_01885 [Candidatus Yanofskybacteria bacterium]|nr:hypothetical protein [Candidatus Yanofskybacteria bacterium]
MEKITLKPSVKELIYKNSGGNVHFDVLSYQGANGQEKMLGSLFILGHIKYADENLAYVVSLISSLAKREYYSEYSLREQNAKGSFERTLKKLNEVLDDFFQNKNFKLDIGLAAISGDNIYISRLGKFKIALARNGRYIDILNNIELFSKDAEGEKQFSNIISGKVQPNDKIFAYFPFRSITSREKQLNDIFVKDGQDEFGQKIAHLAANATNFSCCGVHMDIREIKEIPISAMAPKTIRPVQIKSEKTDGPSDKLAASLTTNSPNSAAVQKENQNQLLNEEPTKSVSLQELPEQSRIIPAEFLVSKRVNIFTPLLNTIKKLGLIGKLNNRAHRHSFIALSVIVLIPILAFVLLKTGGNSGTEKNIIKQAGENLKLAESRITQNNLRDARSLLQASLVSLTDISGKKADDTKQQINQILDGLDHASNKEPVLFADPTVQNQNFKANFITAAGDLAFLTDSDGIVSSVTPNENSNLSQFKIIPQFLFSIPSGILLFNGSETFGVYNLESKKMSEYSLKDASPAVDAILYENNLYTLSGNIIYKYADAATGGTKRTGWSNSDQSANLLSITADGNIYALTSEGKLFKYFKGEKVGESDLKLIPASGSRIFTSKDSAFIYQTDKANKRVYIFDKTTGEIKTTYKLDTVGTPQDISISPDGTIWILSADNKIWTIK